MQSRKRWLLRVVCLGCAFGLVLLAVPTQAQQFAYVTNPLSDSVSVIDTATNTVIATVRGIARPIGVAVTPNGSRVYVTDTLNYVVTVIDTATNTAFAGIGVGPIPWALAITPDGHRVYVTCTTTVYVIDTTTNTVIAAVGVGNGAVGIAVTPDGSRAYVTNGPLNTVSVIDTATNTLIATVGVSNGAVGIAVTPDGSRAYVTNGLLNTVSVIDTATNTLIATVGVGYGPDGIAVSPDGSRAYVTTTLGIVSVDTATNAVMATVGVGAESQGLAITPDGAHVYVTNFASNSVSVVDTATNTVVTTVAVGAGPHGVAITPGSPTTLTSSRNPSIYGQKMTFTATVKPACQVTTHRQSYLHPEVLHRNLHHRLGDSQCEWRSVSLKIEPERGLLSDNRSLLRRCQQPSQHFVRSESAGAANHQLGHAHFVAESVHARPGGNIYRYDHFADRHPDRPSHIHAREDTVGNSPA